MLWLTALKEKRLTRVDRVEERCTMMWWMLLRRRSWCFDAVTKSRQTRLWGSTEGRHGFERHVHVHTLASRSGSPELTLTH